MINRYIVKVFMTQSMKMLLLGKCMYMKKKLIFKGTKST